MDAVKRLLTHPWVVRVAQLVIGVVFAWAALAKISDLRGFAMQVHNFRIVPVPLENLVAMTLPWIELVAAMALLLGIRARAGALVTTVLMVAFTVAVGAAVAQELDIECGCFGTGDATRVGTVKLIENVGLTALSVVATLRARAG